MQPDIHNADQGILFLHCMDLFGGAVHADQEVGAQRKHESEGKPIRKRGRRRGVEWEKGGKRTIIKWTPKIETEKLHPLYLSKITSYNR